MSKFTSFVKLAFEEKIILLQILIITVFFVPILKLIPFRIYSSKIMQYDSENSEAAISKLFTIKKVYKIFEKNFPMSLKCFTKSLLFCILLRINKLPYKFHLSWQNDKKSIKLHTFVSSNGYYLVEPVEDFNNII